MPDAITVLAVIGAYVGFLFLVAVWADRSRAATRFATRHGIVYSLSLAVYCTSWTYYGSVGKAATAGPLFLPIYFGPTIAILLWWTVLRKLVRIKRQQRITSIADFVSSRYGKSEGLAALVTVMALVGILPYIALQLKSVASTFHLLTAGDTSPLGHWLRDNFRPLVVVLMTAFTVVFGVRRLDPTERHQGMVVALATECVVKLVGLLAAGIFVTYYLFDGFGDIAARVASAPAPSNLVHESPSFVTWTTFGILSASAVLFLPRQFHVAVVENSDEQHIRTAQWALPLYLLLINIFVFPIAWGGVLLGHPVAQADTFVLRLPFESGQTLLSLLVFIGGFSAATGMIMISAMTMSTMVTNHLVLPVIERAQGLRFLRQRLLQCRWAAVALFLAAGELFAMTIGDSYMLVNMGMMSFAAVLQFAPAIVGGLFWRRGNRTGALLGLTSGFSMWVYTLLLPAMARSGWLPESFLEHGPFGLELLRPHQLLGLAGLDSLSHAVFWTMVVNISGYVLGSLWTTPSRDDQETADAFVSALQRDQNVRSLVALDADIALEGKLDVIRELFGRYLQQDHVQANVDETVRHAGLAATSRITVLQLADLRQATECLLAGSIGGAAAHHAVRHSDLFTIAEREQLARAYQQILTSLQLTPEDLHRRISYYQERESLIQRHSDELEMLVEKRTADLEATNHNLKREIAERERAERERQLMDEKLREASRQAGMAEVASGVLHNVGNILNSVTVSTNLLLDTIKESRVTRLRQTVQLLEEHRDELTGYLTADARGSKLVDYLGLLTAELEKERQRVQSETEQLDENVGHIRRVVHMQQSLAKSGSVTECVDLQTLVEDAIKIDMTGSEAFTGEIVRDYRPLEPIVTDKHKLLQILVNLVSNARHAIRDAGETAGRIEVAVFERAGRVLVVVRDNGIGISDAIMAKIFRHGFTTRREGHGFGLHSCALAAKELGGNILVHSAGTGRGAEFTVDLPAVRNAAATT